MGLPLVTKAEYKAYAGITSTTQDATIDSIIPKVSELAKAICGRTFIDYVNDAKVEYFDGGLPDYLPKEFPVLSVSSLEYSTDFGNTYSALTEFSDFVVRKSNDSIHSLSSVGFAESVNGYKLTYTAGYETLPSDLKIAILDLITYYIKNDAAIHSNKAPGTNTVQIEYVTSNSLPAHIKRVFDLYTANLA